jgi:hypothetical protein
MIIYVAHASAFDYQNELYTPLRESQLNTEHTIVLPHEHSTAQFNSKEFLKKCDLVLAEVSYPSKGREIELGWASEYGVPIIYLFKKGTKGQDSPKDISNTSIEYDNVEEMITKLSKALNMNETTPIFRPVKPFDYYLLFKEEKPNPTWEEYLNFFLNTFPQHDAEGKLNYLIEGGTVIKILHPERSTPTDIDVLDLKGGLYDKIGPNTAWFNADTLDQWFVARSLKPSEAAKHMIVQDPVQLTVSDKSVTVMNPRVIAMTKLLPYRGRPLREKDIADFKILNYPESEIQEMVKKFLSLCEVE